MQQRSGSGRSLAHSITTFALVALACLLCEVRAARAQIQGGHWVIFYSYSGTTTLMTNAPGTAPQSQDWATVGGIPGDFSIPVAGGYSGTAYMSGSVTVTGMWLDVFTGQPAPNPPARATFRVDLLAGYSYTPPAGVQGSGQAADDGWADTLTVSQDGSSGTSQGSHLIVTTSGTGQWTRTYNLSANINVNVSPGSSVENLSVTGNVSVSEDPRGVQIGSSVDISYMRGPNGEMVACLPDDGGVTHAHSYLPPDQVFAPLNSVDYTPQVFGMDYWFQDSAYHWWARLPGQDVYGTFSPDPVPPIGWYYNRPPFTVGDEEHILLELTDSYDGVKASNNYYILWHAKYDPPINTASLDHPIPLGTDPNSVPPDWTYYGFTQAVGPAGGSVTISGSYSTTATEEGTIDGTVVTQASDPDGFDQLSAHWGINSTTSIQVSWSESATINLPPNTYAKIYVAKIHTEHWGTMAKYGYHGFEGDKPAYGDQYPNSNGQQKLSMGNGVGWISVATQP